MFPSESYLVLCGIVFVIALIACRFAVSRADRTDELPALPMPAAPDPYELAYLRNGRSAVECLVVLELLHSGHLCARRQEASFWRLRPARTILEKVGDGQGLPWYLSAALERFSTPKIAADMNNLWGDQWPCLQTELEERLNKDQLLVTEEVKTASRAAKVVSLIVLGALLVPLLPVILSMKLPAILWILVAVLAPVFGACDPGRLSRRGKAYLARLQSACRGEPAVAFSPGATAASVTFTLGVTFAVLGAESLKDTPYESLDEMSDSGDSGDGGDGGGDD